MVWVTDEVFDDKGKVISATPRWVEDAPNWAALKAPLAGIITGNKESEGVRALATAVLALFPAPPPPSIETPELPPAEPEIPQPELPPVEPVTLSTGTKKP